MKAIPPRKALLKRDANYLSARCRFMVYPPPPPRRRRSSMFSIVVFTGAAKAAAADSYKERPYEQAAEQAFSRAGTALDGPSPASTIARGSRYATSISR